MIETRTAKLWMDEDGILRVEVLPNITTTRADAEECIAEGIKLAGSSLLVLIDIRKALGIERDARETYAQQPYSKAMALLVTSPLSKMLANFFIRLSRSTSPIKIFTSENEASEWLRGFNK